MKMLDRRGFIRTTLFGGMAAATLPAAAMNVWDVRTARIFEANSRVTLATGGNRADMAFRALQPFAKEIAAATRKRRIVVKPNMVTSTIQLCATHRDSLEGILEFYKSINRLDNVVIAESAADGPAMTAYSNYGYIPLAEKYKVKLVDLDETTPQLLYVMDELDIRPKPVRMSQLLMDRDNFVMSVARMKTHDRVVATLSLKNVAVGAPIKDQGFTWGKTSRKGSRSDKGVVHGNGFRGINFNLFNIAYNIRPDLAFIDGFDGMEGDGPNHGTPVDHRVCIASLDWLAADRVGVELMGVDPATVGYLTFCAQAGMGQYDMSRIEIVGEPLTGHIRRYKLSRNIEKQLQWMMPLREKAESLY